jgi:hypothetical protein
MGPTCMAFMPVTAVSPDAPALERSLKAAIEAGVASGAYSHARQKQHAIQLAHLARNEPDLESVLGQTFNTKPSAYASDYHSTAAHQFFVRPPDAGSQVPHTGWIP